MAFCYEWPENPISSTPVRHRSVRNVVVSRCFVHVGKKVRGSQHSVWLSALVFVEMQLLHLLLQERHRHGASSDSLWHCVNL